MPVTQYFHDHRQNFEEREGPARQVQMEDPAEKKRLQAREYCQTDEKRGMGSSFESSTEICTRCQMPGSNIIHDSKKRYMNVITLIS